MILRNLQVAGKESLCNIHIRNGKINAIAAGIEDLKGSYGEEYIEFDNAIAFPGLINSHDHLDFNLFPQLGNRIYNNYTEWGKDIHEKNKEIINEVLKVPEELRVQWGIYKNLLNGVTTVVNHGKKLKIQNDLITVVQFNSLHSPQFEKNWKRKLSSPFIRQPVAMHIGEGTDENAKKEIGEVIRWNIWKKKIVAVHGVAMNEMQANSFHGLVWCPASNYFLLGKTAEIKKLKDKIEIVFGTDSTLTASWNMWEHFRIAKRSGTSETELLSMLTTGPAKLWGLNGDGELTKGKNADIVIVKRKNFFDLNPEDILLVMHQGNIRLVDETIKEKIKNFVAGEFSSININGNTKFVKGDLPALMKMILKQYNKAAFPYS